MRTGTGGRERNDSELCAVFKAAGLTVTRLIRLQSGFGIVEGMPAKKLNP
jgi:hypothetical protein